jgi:hypothetical protein
MKCRQHLHLLGLASAWYQAEFGGPPVRAGEDQERPGGRWMTAPQ